MSRFEELFEDGTLKTWPGVKPMTGTMMGCHDDGSELLERIAADRKRYRESAKAMLKMKDYYPTEEQIDDLAERLRHEYEAAHFEDQYGSTLRGRGDNRPGWDDYFMGLAFMVSRRSHDEQTKHGCVIVDRHHHVIGMGYNGHIRGGKDTLPVTRPEKYPFMIHSEPNALANCVIPPWLVPGGTIAYITGRPCLLCSQLLWQNHVTEWVLAERKGWTQPRQEEEAAFAELELDKKINIRWIKPNLNWLFDRDLMWELRDLGFVER